VPKHTSSGAEVEDGEKAAEAAPLEVVDDPVEELERDWGAILQYILATALQFSLIRLTLLGLQYVTTDTPLSQGVIPTVIVAVFFFFMALKSRVFSPIDNSRCAKYLTWIIFHGHLTRYREDAAELLSCRLLMIQAFPGRRGVQG
jgi:hypothetical protein